MAQTEYLHHYTTIDALALILRNRTIRFNRLDRIDDVRESHAYGKYHLSRLLFVSCWTASDEESIALWHMYSRGMTGIRISLPLDPFDYQPIAPHPIWGGQVTGQLLSILPIDQIFTDEYMVNPTWMTKNKRSFIRKVEYVDEEGLSRIREQAVQFVERGGQLGWEIEGPQELADYKSKVWEFQTEVRYVLMIYPTPPIPSSGISDPTWIQSVPNFVMKSISEGTGPDKDCIDLGISQNALDHIRVTLAPLATEADKIIVEAVLQTHAPNGVLSESNLTYSIRQPRK